MELVLLGCLGAAAIGAIALFLLATGGNQESWPVAVEHITQTFGLTLEPGDIDQAMRATGVVSGVPVVFELTFVEDGRRQTRLIARPSHLPERFALERRPFIDRLTDDDPPPAGGEGGARAPGFHEVTLDNPVFDALVRVRGDEHTARAVLDAHARPVVQAALADGVVVERGEVRWSHDERFDDRERLERALRQVVALAQVLDTPDIRARLLQGAMNEPNAKAAQRALTTLIERGPLTHDEADALLGAQRPTVVLMAAPFVGERAWAAVVDLVVRGPHEVQAQAIAVLRRIDHTRAAEVARRRIGKPRPPEVAVALLEVLVSAQTCPPLANLAWLMASTHTAVRLALARCLEHSTEGAEAQLLELLADSDEKVACAAARALARQGTVDAVAPLRRRIQGFRVWADLEQAAEATIAALQAPVGSHLGGSLSFPRAQSAEGGLSIEGPDAEDPKGRNHV